MAAVAQATTHTRISFITSSRRRVKFARNEYHLTKTIPALDESKRVLHNVPCKTGLSVPAIKTELTTKKPTISTKKVM